jgi:hypothetical protein
MYIFKIGEKSLFIPNQNIAVIEDSCGNYKFHVQKKQIIHKIRN